MCNNQMLVASKEQNNVNSITTINEPGQPNGKNGKGTLLEKLIQMEAVQTNPLEKGLTGQTESEIKALESKYSYMRTGTTLLNMPLDTTPDLWEPFLKKQGLVTLTGSSDIGKSSLLRQLAISIALNKDTFLDHPLNPRHGRVIYFTTEDNQTSISTLLKKQLNGIAPEELSGLCFVFNPEEPLNAITEQLSVGKTDAVIIDCVSDIFEGQMNDIGHVRRFLNKFDKLSIEHDCLFIFLHHNGKRTEGWTPNKNNIIGSQGFEAKMRVVMELKKEEDIRRTLWFTKGNYLPENLKKEALQLNFDDKQEFTYTGKVKLKVSGNKKYSGNNVFKQVLKEIKKRNKNLSLDNIRKEMLLLDPENTPSKGTLHKWVKELDEEDKESDNLHPDECVE